MNKIYINALVLYLSISSHSSMDNLIIVIGVDILVQWTKQNTIKGTDTG